MYTADVVSRPASLRQWALRRPRRHRWRQRLSAWPHVRTCLLRWRWQYDDEELVDENVVQILHFGAAKGDLKAARQLLQDYKDKDMDFGLDAQGLAELLQGDKDWAESILDAFGSSTGIVNALAFICGACLVCTGPAVEKAEMIFEALDFDGTEQISMDEMTIALLCCARGFCVMSGVGIVPSDEDLESVTLQAYRDSNKGSAQSISKAEFTKWIIEFSSDTGASPSREVTLQDALEQFRVVSLSAVLEEGQENNALDPQETENAVGGEHHDEIAPADELQTDQTPSKNSEQPSKDAGDLLPEWQSYEHQQVSELHQGEPEHVEDEVESAVGEVFYSDQGQSTSYEYDGLSMAGAGEYEVSASQAQTYTVVGPDGEGEKNTPGVDSEQQIAYDSHEYRLEAHVEDDLRAYIAMEDDPPHESKPLEVDAQIQSEPAQKENDEMKATINTAATNPFDHQFDAFGEGEAKEIEAELVATEAVAAEPPLEPLANEMEDYDDAMYEQDFAQETSRTDREADESKEDIHASEVSEQSAQSVGALIEQATSATEPTYSEGGIEATIDHESSESEAAVCEDQEPVAQGAVQDVRFPPVGLEDEQSNSADDGPTPTMDFNEFDTYDYEKVDSSSGLPPPEPSELLDDLGLPTTDVDSGEAENIPTE